MTKTKSKAGGGVNSNKVVKKPVKAGPPSTNKISECAVGQIGTKLGNPQAIEKIHAGTAPQVPMGNAVALNSGQRPGQGRQIHAQGTQGTRDSGGPPKPAGRSWQDDFLVSKNR